MIINLHRITDAKKKNKEKYEKESEEGFILLNIRTYYESHCNQINKLLK